MDDHIHVCSKCGTNFSADLFVCPECGLNYFSSRKAMHTSLARNKLGRSVNGLSLGKRILYSVFFAAPLFFLFISLAIHGNTKFMYAYAYFPIIFLIIGYGMKKKYPDPAWLSTKITSPVWLNAIVLVFSAFSTIDYFISLSIVMCTTIFLSIVILQYELYRIKNPKPKKDRSPGTPTCSNSDSDVYFNGKKSDFVLWLKQLNKFVLPVAFSCLSLLVFIFCFVIPRNTFRHKMLIGGATVYVTKHGDCYHSDPDCSGMTSPIARNKYWATEEGYAACSKCYNVPDPYGWYHYFFAIAIGCGVGLLIHYLMHRGSAPLPRVAISIQPSASSDTIFCKHCGKQIDGDSSFCRYCGKPQNSK